MNTKERAGLEDALRSYYRSERETDADLEARGRRTLLLTRSSEPEERRYAQRISSFAWMTLRSSPRMFWLAPASVIVLSLVLAHAGVSAHEAEAVLAGSGAWMAAAGLVGIVRAKSSRMQELEASCLHNSVAVASSRLLAFGAVALTVLALTCIACASVVPIWIAAAHALAPYLLSAAGGLMLARRAASSNALLAGAAWSAGVLAACLMVMIAAPAAYEAAACWAWAMAVAVGALWLGREVVCWLRMSAEGGCAPAVMTGLAAW